MNDRHGWIDVRYIVVGLLYDTVQLVMTVSKWHDVLTQFTVFCSALSQLSQCSACGDVMRHLLMLYCNLMANGGSLV